MVKRNPHLSKLNAGYLFPEILRRKKLFLEKKPDASLISLGIGDTTEPIVPFIAQAMREAAEGLATEFGYSGYGPEEGVLELRSQIATSVYHELLDPSEIFISDGTNSDIGRLQILFGGASSIAVQDPSYPVYVDTSVIMGQTGAFNADCKGYGNIAYLPCLATHDFFPNLQKAKRADIIYFCSPNNPTGAVATFEQLEALVQFAKKERSLIVFDTAYASYIQDPQLPRSIYAIKGAKEVAIELGSFSKMAGFTGVRLGWSVVPHELCYDAGESVNRDWMRVHATFFNGATNIVQQGGIAALGSEGQKGIQEQIAYYLENAALLRSALLKSGKNVYGGINAPYLWVAFPGKTSWEAFDHLLENVEILSAPGSGFGPGGEGYIRFSAFGKRSKIEEAARRLAAL